MLRRWRAAPEGPWAPIRPQRVGQSVVGCRSVFRLGLLLHELFPPFVFDPRHAHRRVFPPLSAAATGYASGGSHGLASSHGGVRQLSRGGVVDDSACPWVRRGGHVWLCKERCLLWRTITCVIAQITTQAFQGSIMQVINQAEKSPRYAGRCSSFGEFSPSDADRA